MVVPFKEAVIDPTFSYLSALDEQMKVVVNSTLKPDEKIKQYNHLLDNFRLGVPARTETTLEQTPQPVPQPSSVYITKRKKTPWLDILSQKKLQSQIKKLSQIHQSITDKLEASEEEEEDLEKSQLDKFVDVNETLSSDQYKEDIVEEKKAKERAEKKKENLLQNYLKNTVEGKRSRISTKWYSHQNYTK